MPEEKKHEASEGDKILEKFPPSICDKCDFYADTLWRYKDKEFFQGFCYAKDGDDNVFPGNRLPGAVITSCWYFVKKEQL